MTTDYQIRRVKQMSMSIRLAFLCATFTLVFGVASVALANPTLEIVDHGQYWRYVPRSSTKKSPVLAICHGMLGKDADAKQEALGIASVWVDFANKTGAVLVAPVFTDEDYGAGTGCPHGWGYRALYGRHVGADEFLHEIVASLKKLNPDFDGKLFLFGHSAGGQFVSHYVVKHPDRVHSAVISATTSLADRRAAHKTSFPIQRLDPRLYSGSFAVRYSARSETKS